MRQGRRNAACMLEFVKVRKTCLIHLCAQNDRLNEMTRKMELTIQTSLCLDLRMLAIHIQGCYARMRIKSDRKLGN